MCSTGGFFPSWVDPDPHPPRGSRYSIFSPMPGGIAGQCPPSPWVLKQLPDCTSSETLFRFACRSCNDPPDPAYDMPETCPHNWFSKLAVPASGHLTKSCLWLICQEPPLGFFPFGRAPPHKPDRGLRVPEFLGPVARCPVFPVPRHGGDGPPRATQGGSTGHSVPGHHG